MIQLFAAWASLVCGLVILYAAAMILKNGYLYIEEPNRPVVFLDIIVGLMLITASICIVRSLGRIRGR